MPTTAALEQPPRRCEEDAATPRRCSDSAATPRLCRRNERRNGTTMMVGQRRRRCNGVENLLDGVAAMHAARRAGAQWKSGPGVRNLEKKKCRMCVVVV
ncbi:hypothetical protein DEO72_LG11g865 [Vigna unguiculata]|uniref:Uncharacterized protein n=1 Tax=Vigna unguiculata TaxID=3917 RepID=A0A4D6NPX7_VIGUN|nr:hypothetical protein DEO72_LG11g865 [Vigna unguiculata]